MSRVRSMRMTACMLRGTVGVLLALVLALTAWAAPALASQRPARARTTMPPARAGQALHALASYPYKFSRIARAGSDVVIAATDSHGDLYYFWQASGSTTWHKQLVAEGGSGSAYSKPSIAWTGHAVVIAALNSSGGLVYFALKAGGTTWKHQVVATASGGKYQSPAVTAASDGSVLISAGNTSGKLLSFELAAGGTTWAGETAGYGLFGPSSITTGSGFALITAASGGNLYLWWQFLGGTAWNQETIASAGPSGSYKGGSITTTDNDVLVTAVTTAGAVDLWSQAFGSTSGWAQQTVAAPSGGTSYSSPAVAWTGDVGEGASYDVVTATDQAGNLDYWWTPDGGTIWTPEKVAAAGTRAVYASPGIAITGTAVVITAINTKPGDVLYWYQPFITNLWHQQVVATG